MERNYFNLYFVARASKANKSGESPLEVVISVKGHRSYFTLPMRLRSSDFDKMIKQKRKNTVKEFCDIWKSRIENYYLSSLKENYEPSLSDIHRFISNGGEFRKITLDEAFRSFLKYKGSQWNNGQLSYSVYRKYILTIELFKSISDKEFITEITTNDIYNYQVHLLGKYDVNTAEGYFRRLKSAFIYLKDEGTIKDIPFTAGNRIKKQMKYLETFTDEEFVRICNKTFGVERIERVRKIFIFMCCSGLAYSDVVALKQEDFTTINGKLCIVKNRVKTDHQFISVILDEAIPILSELNYNLDSLKISNQRMNSYLKEIQDILNINSIAHLTCHCARHYYAMRLLNSGISLEVVAKCMGHTNVKTTLQYCRLRRESVVASVASAFG